MGHTSSSIVGTVGYMTYVQVPISDSVGSVTRRCCLYQNQLDLGAAAWLDTVGWEDLEKDDNSTFREILRYVQENEIEKVLAVVWCVSPQVG